MKRALPWILGVGAIGASVFYWRKKARSAKKIAGEKDLAAAKVSINATAAMDEVNIPADKKLSQADKDNLAFSFIYQSPDKLRETAASLKAKGYVKLAEGFTTQATVKSAVKK